MELIFTVKVRPRGPVDIQGIKEEAAKSYELFKAGLYALRPVSRERSEEAWRGDWIAVRPEFAGHDHIGGYKCSRCKEEAVLDCNDEFVLDNFCPRCGAAMTDEAVEMVMERWEGYMKKPIDMKPVCDKCGKEAPIDHEMSTAQWKVYRVKEPCECGGCFKPKFMLEALKDGKDD